MLKKLERDAAAVTDQGEDDFASVDVNNQRCCRV